MNYRVIKFIIGTFFLFIASIAYSISVIIPDYADPGSMFVVEIKLSDNETQTVQVKFDANVLQYAGPLEPTTDVQSLKDNIVEINNSSGTEKRYLLKFLALPNAASTTITVLTNNESQFFNIRFVSVDEKKNYHLHLLMMAIILLVLAKLFWNYQKKNPALMSTRSLFMNFEDLQKIKAQYFPESNEKNEEKKPTDSIIEQVYPATTSQEVSEKTQPNLIKQLWNSSSNNDVENSSSESQNSGTISRKLINSTSNNIQTNDIQSEQTVSNSIVESTSNAIKTKVSKSINDLSEAKTVVVSVSSSVIPIIRLVLTDESGRKFIGEGNEITCGRRKDNTIVIPASEVSRVHVIFKIENNKFIIVPVSETNPTEVNGVQIKSATPIQQGDTITLASLKFKIEQLVRNP